MMALNYMYTHRALNLYEWTQTHMLNCWSHSRWTSSHMGYSFYWADIEISKDDWRLVTSMKALAEEIQARERATVLHHQCQGADQLRRFWGVQLCCLIAEMDHPAHIVTNCTTQTFAKLLRNCKQRNISFRNHDAASTALSRSHQGGMCWGLSAEEAAWYR